MIDWLNSLRGVDLALTLPAFALILIVTGLLRRRRR
jgi:hypothetical protein